MVNTKKFSQFATAPLTDANNKVVGLEGGINVQSVRFLSWTTAGRPASPFNGLLGLNTTLEQYEFWDSLTSSWTQLEDSGDINDILARLASHAVGEGASLIGLQDQSNVTTKTVQDLANATFIAQTSNGTLQNAQYLGSLTTGIVKNTTGTGVLSISAPLTSIDGLTTVANNLIYTTASNTYAVITPANSSTLISSAGGVPSWSQTLPTAVQSNITQLGAQSQALNMNTHLINNVVDPVSAQDAATRNYVDTIVANFAVVFVARLASTVALTATYNNGSSGVGATLTNAGAMAALSLDGTAAANGDLVLIKDQVSALQNGYYVVTSIGSGASNWELTRSAAYDLPAEINPGDLFVITSGATLAKTAWLQTDTVTSVGVDSISFIQFSVALPITVPNGGTGVTSFTAYAVITGGTTATGALQSIASVGTAGQLLTSNGAGALPSFQTLSAFTSIVQQVFTSSGTYTPTSGMKYCIIEVVGSGGGGGGGAGVAATSSGAGGGGGGGAYSRSVKTAADIGVSQAVTIGAAGTGGAAGTNSGNAGSACSVGTLVTANGGGGGNGSVARTTINFGGGGGAGGTTGGTGDFKIAGQDGALGFVGDGVNGITFAGAGGSTFFGPGTQVIDSDGNAGTLYGSGGGGAGAANADVAGHDGATGVVVITEFI